MTKIEIINEMYNVINNNADVFQYADKYMINVYAKDVKTTKKATLEQYLAKLNAMVEEANNEETVETEYVDEPKATKKDIIMGLHKNDEVKCDLATAEALATEGFIDIKSYEDGVLYGNINTVNIIRDMCDNYCGSLVYSIIRWGGFNHDYLNSAMVMFDHKLISSLEYEGDRGWRAEVNWDNILTEFCKRLDKLSEVA